jgi:hypothetical protein
MHMQAQLPVKLACTRVHMHLAPTQARTHACMQMVVVID